MYFITTAGLTLISNNRLQRKLDIINYGKHNDAGELKCKIIIGNRLEYPIFKGTLKECMTQLPKILNVLNRHNLNSRPEIVIGPSNP